MKISVVAVGKIREKYLRDAIEEYTKRITKYTTIGFNEVKETEHVLRHISQGDYVVCLDINGTTLDSVEFSGFLNKHLNEGTKKICFIIGGADGLTCDILNKANYTLSFSKMTFPHQLMRVILTEQIYRGFSILNNEPYHK